MVQTATYKARALPIPIHKLFKHKFIDMKNWKTLICGAIAALPYIVKFFTGHDLPFDLSDICQGTGLFGLGLLSKDYNVTGGTKQQ